MLVELGEKNSERASLVGIRFLVYFLGLLTWRMKKNWERSSWLKMVIFYKMVRRRNSKQRLKGSLDKRVGRENLSKIFIELPPPPILYDIMQETVHTCTIAV